MQKTAFSVEEIAQFKDCNVYDTTGDRIGKMDRVYFDDETGRPEWIGVDVGFLGLGHVLAPVQGTHPFDNGIQVSFAKDKVKRAPDIGGDEIDPQQEQQLCQYYGLATQPATGPTRSPGKTDGGTMTLSEEQLKVGKRQVETGKVRLRKYVETTPVNEQVQLRQERAEVYREPVNRPVSGAQIGEQEAEVTLRGEEPVVEKKTVAREQVGVRKAAQSETVPVKGEVRKEHLEVEDESEEEPEA